VPRSGSLSSKHRTRRVGWLEATQSWGSTPSSRACGHRCFSPLRLCPSFTHSTLAKRVSWWVQQSHSHGFKSDSSEPSKTCPTQTLVDSAPSSTIFAGLLAIKSVVLPRSRGILSTRPPSQTSGWFVTRLSQRTVLSRWHPPSALFVAAVSFSMLLWGFPCAPHLCLTSSSPRHSPPSHTCAHHPPTHHPPPTTRHSLPRIAIIPLQPGAVIAWCNGTRWRRNGQPTRHCSPRFFHGLPKGSDEAR
jgi:hypothetical protein